MYHIFFIHSSVDGQLGCFHDLAIVNREAQSLNHWTTREVLKILKYTCKYPFPK